MREIKFRGQKDYCKEWVYGNLIQFRWADFIVKFGSFEDRQRVIPETVGQFTGLKDDNGKEIYEGDIIKTPLGNILTVKSGTVTHKTKESLFQCTGWCIESKSGNLDFLDETILKGEVIGNIHDNPELIK